MMKRLIRTFLAATLLLVLPVTPAIAQVSVDLGFKGGLNMANASGTLEDFLGESLEEFESKKGLAFGGLVTINIGEMFAIQPELLYMQKGLKTKEVTILYDDGTGPVAVEIGTEARMSYLEIPVLAKLKIPAGSVVTPFFYAGPAVAINVSAETKASIYVPSVDWSDTETENIRGETRNVDFGTVIGAGVDLGVGFGHISVDGRYTIGLMNTNHNPDDPSDIKNRAFSFMIGYSFPVSGR